MVKPLSNAERKRKYRQNLTDERKKEIKENDKTRKREKRASVQMTVDKLAEKKKKGQRITKKMQGESQA